jgi:hypothetical protein
MEVKDKTRITAVETRLMGRTAKYTRMDCKRDEETLKEPKTVSTLDNISKCKVIRFTRSRRIQKERLPKVLKINKPQGLGNVMTTLEETFGRLRSERVNSHLIP